MSDEAKCCECGRTVSYETGFTFTGGLADNSKDRLYCPDCAPGQGKGYTLADLERMREESQKARDERQMRLIEQLGADVYFHVLGPTYPPEEV